MPDRIQKLTLAHPVFTPADIKFAEYTPQQEDMSLLANSLARMEERKRTANEKISAMDVAFGEMRSKLHQDEETLKWFDNYAKNYKNQVNAFAQLGDYGNAINSAVRLAGEAANDPSLQGRIKSNIQYEQEVERQRKRLADGKISQNTFKWWLKNNPYTYSDIKDENGNIVGGTEYRPNTPAYDDINFAALAQTAFRMITPKKGHTSKDGSTNVQNGTAESLTRNGVSYQPGEHVGSSWHQSNQFEKVSIQDIRNNMAELLAAAPDGPRQVEQAFKVAMDDFKELVEDYKAAAAEDPNSDRVKTLGQQIDARKQLFYRNSSKIDYQEYYARMIANSLFAENLAYDWRTTSSGGTSTYGLFNSGAGNDGGKYTYSPYNTPGSTWDFERGMWKTPNVRMDNDSKGGQQTVSNAVSNISGRFKQDNTETK